MTFNTTHTLPHKLLISLSIFLFLSINVLFAQKALLTKANEAFARYEYANAAKIYEKTNEKAHNEVFVISRLANCYREMNNYAVAEKYYTQLISLPGASADEWLYFGDMLKSTGNYVAAKEIYQQYLQRSVDEIAKKQVADKMAGCDSAVYWIAHPDGYSIENMAYLNTGKSDWGAVFNPNTNSVIFVSDSLRNTKKGFFKKTFNDAIYGRTDNYFQKIYAISNTKDDPFNNQIHEFDPIINAYQFHTGPVVFSANYDSIYFTVTNAAKSNGYPLAEGGLNNTAEKYKTRRLELYLSTLNKQGQWNKPIPFPFNNAAAYSVGHAALSADGRVLYFTSDMPGGYGGLDIWYCERLITGNWGLPKNCGRVINTKDDEAFPVIGFDGNLYFASKGHVGMGGYDLFIAAGEKNRWTNPVNMGWPLNAEGDDFYYFPKDDTSGFFASNRKGGFGDDDIYQYTTAGNNFNISKNTKLILETTVIDNATKQPIEATALATLNTNSDYKVDQQTNPIGKSYLLVDNNTPYAITASKQGYYASIVAINTKNATSDTMKVIIPLDNQNGAKPSPKVYKLTDNITALHEGDKFRLNNIHYNFDKDNIRPDAALILDTLVEILNQYPSMMIELSSHTDSRGTYEYNINLADRRAKSAVAYLISRGINRKRLIAKGYGEMLLLNECSDGVVCTEAQHQENRRTEVKVLRF